MTGAEKPLYLVLMQGVPGSGKSTLAKGIAKVVDAVVYSTDEFFYVEGEYKFDPALLNEYHAKNLERTRAALFTGQSVVVDNTNLLQEHVDPYIKAGHAARATIRIVRAEGNGQNCHGVPAEKVEQMRARMQTLEVTR